MRKNRFFIFVSMAIYFSLCLALLDTALANSEILEIPLPVDFVSGDGSAVTSVAETISDPWVKQTFRWTEEDGIMIIAEVSMMNMDWIHVSDINFDGSAIALYIPSYLSPGVWDYPYRWTELLGLELLCPSRPYPCYANTGGISDDGSVITGLITGYSSPPTGVYIWKESTGMVAIGMPPLNLGQYIFSTIISGDGQTIIVNSIGAYNYHCFFRWRESTGYEEFDIGEAVDISSDGNMIVGITPDGQAFRYSDANGLQEIGSFSPVAANADCSIIVSSEAVWDESNGIQPIEDYLVSKGIDIDSEGWILDSVTDISADGRVIIGNGYNDVGATIIDNLDQNFNSGPSEWSWSSVTAGGYDTYYQYAPPGDGSKWAEWTFFDDSEYQGTYGIFAQWTSADNRATDATYTIGGIGYTVDQTKNGGEFIFLGDGILTEFNAFTVELNDTPSGYVIADAIKVLAMKGWIAKIDEIGPPSEIIIDNNGAGFTSGPSAWSWSSFTPGGYNTTYQYAAPGDGSKWARWTFTLSSAGNCEVFAQWTDGSNRSSAAPYTIINNGTPVSAPVTRDQTVNGGQFRSLGTFWLDAGTVEIELNNTPTGYVIADAVKIVSEQSGPPTLDHIEVEGPSMVDENTEADYVCRAYYTDNSSTLVPADSWTTGCSSADIDEYSGHLSAYEVDSNETCLVTVSYTEDNIEHQDSFELTIRDTDTPPPPAEIIIDNGDAGFSSGPSQWSWSSFTPGGYNTMYQYALPGDGSKWARWTFNLANSGNCEVFAQWTASDNRSSAAPYTIINNGTPVSAPITRDQTVNGGQFISLGIFPLNAGTVEVVLNDTPTGYVIADAVKIISEQSGPPPDEVIIDNPDAGFSSGPSAWSWSSFSPGGYDTSYQYAAPGNGSKWAKWTFTLESSGNCEIFAQWTASDNRSTSAPYTVFNNGTPVSAPVTRDQTVNGGQFISLGIFPLNAGTVVVELNDTPTGYVIADAVKIVAE